MIHKCNYAQFFTKVLIETNWKSENFRVIDRLISFSAIKKTVTVLGDVFLFSSLFSSVHINFQYKLNSHKTSFIITENSFFYSFTHFFSSASLLFNKFFNFSLCIQWIRIHEFSPWHCLISYLISIQERASKHYHQSLIWIQFQK